MKKSLIALSLILVFLFSFMPANSAKSVLAESELNMKVKSSLLLDYNSGEVLFEDNADERVQVASIVKLMTALLTMEEIENGNLSLDEKLISTENAAGMGGSQVFIDPYCEYSIDEMLKSLIVASANDASVALAEKIAGSEENFVERMNKRAKELGLENTNYVNASGLPEPGQYSTAKDVALLTKEVLNHELYFKYSTIWMDELVHPSGRKTEVVNTNKLIRYFNGCDAGKTGSTDEAGYCLSASAKRGNMRLISVVLGATTSTERFNEASKLLNFGFTNFENKQIVNKNESLSNIPVLKSKLKEIEIFPLEDYYAISKINENSNYEIVLDIPKSIKAPQKEGDKIGELKVLKDGVVVKTIDVILKNNIEKLKYKDGLKEIIANF
ncbi:MAG: D-alanyl-D-alanine carboxypeptidase [Clostridia bacterium]|nr:D-alanyl-D-alanine carboxypeptidase [Clostridia bacterium]